MSSSHRPWWARLLLLAGILWLFGAAPSPRAASVVDPPPAQIVRTVVIDPGHGGSEEGAKGASGLTEKELTLDIARRLAAILRADGFDVTQTRDGDDDMTLDSRAAVANNKRADVFISLHANASRAASARGAETYILATEATDDAARTTAALENDAVGMGKDAPTEGELPLILWDLAQVEYLKESAHLGGVIQSKLNDVLGLKDRGVKQAPFRVLVGATCPAVLVELGFVTNADEEQLLASSDHRRKLAEALAEAVKQFRAESHSRANR